MKDLQFGQTPWDEADRATLSLEIKRMYAVISAMYSNLKMNKAFHEALGETSPYFMPGGMGARSLEMGRQVLQPYWDEYGSEQMYRAFFRYAIDLLFDDSAGFEIGSRWMACPKCGTFLGGGPKNTRLFVGAVCRDALGFGMCDGIMRKLTWDDLRPGVQKLTDAAAAVEFKFDERSLMTAEEVKKYKRPDCLKPWCGLDGKLCVDCATNSKNDHPG